MPSTHVITVEKLSRLVALPAAPRIVDLRPAPDRMIPGSARPSSPPPPCARIVVVDEDGGTAASAMVAVLRSDGVEAEMLAGGFAAWQAAALPTMAVAHLPARHADGRTWWVTRARPKVDRIACPWFVRRFVDPDARFLFVPPDDVLPVAAREQAVPFDVAADGVLFRHHDERCTFDAMIDAFGLSGHAPLDRIAAIVRGADTGRLDTAPEAAGLLALSLGLSRVHACDHDQLDAGMAIYDALYRWARDATDEKHDASSHRPVRRMGEPA